MSRFYLRFMLIPIVLFTVTLLVIHAQPYDDHELRKLLLPEGCPAPCFMGIRPGITTKDEAIEILKNHPWIKQAEYNPNTNHIGLIWSSSSPAWLIRRTGAGNSLISINRNLVAEIRLDTSLTLADIQLILQRAYQQQVTVYLKERQQNYLSYSAIYPYVGISIKTTNYCVESHSRITYQAKVHLTYKQLSKPADLPANYNDSWSDLIRASCN